MISQARPHVGVLLPSVERFDGTGGAVATWVSHTYVHSAFTAIVACPRHPTHGHPSLQLATHPAYDRFDRGLQVAANVAAAISRRTSAGAYQRLLGNDRRWVRAAYATLVNTPLIHIHNRPTYAFYLRELGYRGRILLHMHNLLGAYLTPDRSHDLHEAVDTIAFCSDFVRLRAQATFDPLPRSVTIHNGVDADQISGRAGRPLGDPLVLAHVGRIIPEKGTLEAIEICTRVNTAGRPCRLVIAGGSGSGSSNDPTPYLAEVRKSAASANEAFGPQTVQVLGPQPHSRVFEIMAYTDGLLLPGAWEEPFGMVALEAMAKGCVPIVPQAGGLPEVVEQGGIVVPQTTDRVGAFTDAILTDLNTANLDHYTEAGVQRAQGLTWDVIAKQLDATLDALL